MKNPETSNSIRVKRFINSSPESVFRAWTTPGQIKQWFGPPACRPVDAQIDLRVGGEYRFRILSEESGELTVRGEYREITHPSRLVLTWQWEDDPDWAGVESIVTLEATARDGGAEVQVAHDGLPSEVHAERHAHGWSGTLDKLSIRGEVISELCGRDRFVWNELVTTDLNAAKAFYEGSSAGRRNLSARTTSCLKRTGRMLAG
jgi:uncharacterized protein YndB with AHSA1/START domain